MRECNGGIAAEPLFKIIEDTVTRFGLTTNMLAGCAFDGDSAVVKLGRLVNEHMNGRSVYVH